MNFFRTVAAGLVAIITFFSLEYVGAEPGKEAMFRSSGPVIQTTTATFEHVPPVSGSSFVESISDQFNGSMSVAPGGKFVMTETHPQKYYTEIKVYDLTRPEMAPWKLAEPFTAVRPAMSPNGFYVLTVDMGIRDGNLKRDELILRIYGRASGANPVKVMNISHPGKNYLIPDDATIDNNGLVRLSYIANSERNSPPDKNEVRLHWQSVVEEDVSTNTLLFFEADIKSKIQYSAETIGTSPLGMRCFLSDQDGLITIQVIGTVGKPTDPQPVGRMYSYNINRKMLSKLSDANAHTITVGSARRDLLFYEQQTVYGFRLVRLSDGLRLKPLLEAQQVLSFDDTEQVVYYKASPDNVVVRSNPDGRLISGGLKVYKAPLSAWTGDK